MKRFPSEVLYLFAAACARPAAGAFLRAGPLALQARHQQPRVVALTAAAQLLADDALELPTQLQAFQDSHAFLIGILLTVVSRVIINETRYRIEKPVMDKAGEAVKTNLTPDRSAIVAGDWAKLGGCVALDLAGDVSELIPVLGEFTDVAYAPIEAGLLKALFQSNAIAGFGFVEEILPFTDIIPTFTLAWCLQTLWPTTPLARKLLPQK